MGRNCYGPELGRVSLVMDNARIHHLREAMGFMDQNWIKHVYLPPYSPDLNPIENVFGVLKTRYRSRGVVQNRAEMRRRIIAVTDEMNRDLNLGVFYYRMRDFVARALNRESFN